MRSEQLLILISLLILPSTCYPQTGDEANSPPCSPKEETLPIVPMLHRPVGEERKSYYSLATFETVSEKKLEQMLKKLENIKLTLAIREETREMEVYRLVADCYTDRKTAGKRTAQISRQGIKAFISHVEDKFCTVAGSLMSESAALTGQKRLAEKSVPTRIVKVKVPLTVYGLNIGRFTRLLEAQEAAKSMAAQRIGVTVIIIRD